MGREYKRSWGEKKREHVGVGIQWVGHALFSGYIAMIIEECTRELEAHGGHFVFIFVVARYVGEQQWQDEHAMEGDGVYCVIA